MGTHEGATICLVEDDAEFAGELIQFLGVYGIHTVWLQTIDDLPTRLSALQPDALLLDQFVGGQDAVTGIAGLRRSYAGGIMVLTGNLEVLDRIIALETGADDFVSKLLGPREILARLRAVMRRSQQVAEPALQTRGAAVGPWRINPAKHELYAPDGNLVRMSVTEFRALMVLIDNSLSVVTRDALSRAVLKRPHTLTDRSVDNLMSRVRKMIEVHTNGVPVIRAVRGIGYMFTGLDLQYPDEKRQPGGNVSGLPAQSLTTG